MLKIFFIGIGGAVGSLLRYLVLIFFEKRLNKNGYYATFLVNMIGSFLLGVATGFLIINSTFILVFTVGILGAFTTFSTFLYETLFSFKNNRKKAIIYLIVSVLTGLILFWVGTKITSQIS